LILLMLLVTYLVTKRVIQSNIGLAFKAIGQNMEAARMSGINPVFYRILNFTLFCTIAGWLGGFYAHYYGILTPDLLHTSKTIEVLAVAYIGGRPGSLLSNIPGQPKKPYNALFDERNAKNKSIGSQKKKKTFCPA